MGTRGKIIAVAAKFLTADGYEGVPVREICAAAKVNVAMVNCHFRNKEGLYRECVARLFVKTGGTNPGKLAETVHDAKSWREAVRAWAIGFSKVMHAQV